MDESSNRAFSGGGGNGGAGGSARMPDDEDERRRRQSMESTRSTMMAMTQNDGNDCVVWDESKNIDLRRLAGGGSGSVSPHFETPGSATTLTPNDHRDGGAASTATSSSSLSSSTNNNNPHQNHHQHPHHNGHYRRRRKSSLGEVSRSLQQVTNNRGSSNDNHHHNRRAALPLNNTIHNNNNILAAEQEMDGIFQRLAEDENNNNNNNKNNVDDDALLAVLEDTTTSTPKQANTSTNNGNFSHNNTNNNNKGDNSSEPTTARLRLEAENLYGVQPRRRTRKRQKMLLLEQQQQQQQQDRMNSSHGGNDSNNLQQHAAANTTHHYGRRHHHHRHLRCLAPVNSNTLDAAAKSATATEAVGLTDDFDDLLQEVTARASSSSDNNNNNNAACGNSASATTRVIARVSSSTIPSPVPPPPFHHHPPERRVAMVATTTRDASSSASVHVASSTTSRKVSTTPIPRRGGTMMAATDIMNHERHGNNEDDEDDDFADFDLTMEDLNALDMAATQYQQQQTQQQQQTHPPPHGYQQQQQQQQRHLKPCPENEPPSSRYQEPPYTTAATTTPLNDNSNKPHCEAVHNGEQVVETHTNNDEFEDDDDSDDPFSEFPIVDYDALDNAILQATTQRQGGTNNSSSNPPTSLLSKVHRSPMPGTATSSLIAAVAPKRSSSLHPNAFTLHAATAATVADAPKCYAHPDCNSGKRNDGKAIVNNIDDNDSDDDDGFDDFPDVDFDALDQVIANHATTATTTTQPSVIINTTTVEEGIARDLDYLAKVIRQETAPRPQQQQPAHIFQIPPANAVVRNRRVGQLPVMGELLFPKHSRFKVVQVADDNISFTKTLYVAAWQSAMLNEYDDDKLIHRTLDSAFGPPQRVLTTTSTVDGAIHLRGEWYYTRVVPGDVIHICSLSGMFDTTVAALPLILHTFPPRGSDAQDDLVVIVHPDMLLTPTVISETASCMRRAIIKSRLGSSGLTSKALIFGTMRHELFEHAMRERNFSTSFARDYLDQIIRRNAEGLLASKVSSKEAITEVMKMVPTLQRFATELTAFGPQRQLQTGGLASLQGHGVSPPIHFRAKAVDAIEEPIISHELGLKGNVDMVVKATVVHNQAQGACTTLMGVELKTGHNQRTQNAHLAQLVLYTLMIQGDRGGSRSVIQGGGSLGATNSGVLLYLNAEGLSAVHVAPHLSEMKTLIGQRNHVATEYARSSLPRGVQLVYDNDGDFPNSGMPKIELLDPAPPAVLPELLANDHMCKKCYANRECMMYAASERSSTVPGGDYDPFKTHSVLLGHFTGHLTAADFSYFQEWDRLIDLEAHAGASLAAESWLKSSVEQEKATAKCMSSLVFDQAESLEGVVFDEENSFGTMPVGTMSFTRSKSSSLHTPLFNLGFEKGCHVIVSTDSTSTSPSPRRAKMHIVRGFLDRATESQVFVRATKDDVIRIQKIAQLNARQGQPESLFRLDRDNVATGVGTLRQNLVNLFTGDRLDVGQDDAQPSVTRLSWLRDMIVRLRAPVFQQNISQSEMFRPATQNVPQIPGCDLIDLACEFAELNIDQRNAVLKVWSANDYTLIQGLPGTGKTSTIAFVVRLLAAHGKRVLITSYTHAAVDNVVRKLMQKGLAQTGVRRLLPALVRVGRPSSSHPGVVPVLASEIAASLEKGQRSNFQDDADSPESPLPESLRLVMDSARIVGVTALTIPRSALLLGQEFDVVIVDEAGQISQPAIIGALMTTKSFVLVGDHKQLPPLVTSEAAEQGGYGISMLMRLADRHPSAVAQLTLQYRMHEDICELVNDLVYGGTLKCASDGVRRQKIALPSFLQLHYQAWLQRAVNPDNSVVFLDTDKVDNGEQENQDANNTMYPQERLAGRSSGGSIVNDTEATVVRLVVEGLVAAGLDPSSIGVICPFRAQLRKMDDCTTLCARKKDGLEVSTIDQFQGRDKPTIILSFVRSNVKGRVGRLLSDVRRLNVALSRAKCKLIMVGSFSTLYSGSSVLRPVLDRVKKTGRVVQLSSSYDK